MAGPGTFQGLGSIASEFSRGFMQGRVAKLQEHHQQLQEAQQHIENLARLSDIHKNNPSMRETIDTQLEQAIHNMDVMGQKPKQAPKPGSAGGFFSQIKQFFTGPKKPTGQPPNVPPPIGTPAAATTATPAIPTSTPIGPAPVSHDSRTYGDLGDMFGQATRVATPTMETGVMGGRPRLTQPTSAALATPPEMPAVPSPTVGTAGAAPAAMSSPTARLKPPSQIRAEALSAEQTPKYHYYEPFRVQMRQQQMATESMDEALGMADAVLERSPHIKTFADATADPQIGSTFRQLMDYADRLEGSGLIEKGYAKAWKENRFPDTRPGGEIKPAVTLEDKVERGIATPQDREQWMKNIEDKAKAGIKLSPEEQSYQSAYYQLIRPTEQGGRGMTPLQAHEHLTRLKQAVQQPRKELKETRNPRTQQLEYAWITEGSNTPQYTGVPAKAEFDLRTLRTTQPQYANLGTPEKPNLVAIGSTSDYDPALIINALQRGDIDDQTARLLTQGMMDKTAVGRVNDFLDKNKTNPFGPPQ